MKLQIISCNIRFDNPKDGKHSWKGRREHLAQRINHFSPHIMGTQEGRRPQLKDLESLVNLKMIDTHRDWISERMYPSLFCCLDACGDLRVLESGDIWLSETPYIPGSKSFGSTFPRLATWSRFKFLDREFVMANLHLDHRRGETRLQQIKVFTREIVKKFQSNLPFLLSGDFNDPPGGEVYKWVARELSLLDPWKIIRHPEQSSYHKFNGDTETGERIDWILMSEHFRVDHIFFDTSKSKAGIFSSDHFPLILSCQLNDLV